MGQDGGVVGGEGRVVSRGRAVVGQVLAGVALVGLTGCAGVAHGDAPGARGAADAVSAPAAATVAKADPALLPGVGARLRGAVPADALQAVVVYGDGVNAPTSTLVLYRRAAAGKPWQQVDTWATHNGGSGWSLHHRSGDRRTPVGVFALTDAGGLGPNPGTKLPYFRSADFHGPSTWPPAYVHDFDLVVAIDYNRVAGSSPLDPRRPQGEAAGGGIWLHLDHGSGTAACVTQPRAEMLRLMGFLDPARHPVVVMGDRADLAAS